MAFYESLFQVEACPSPPLDRIQFDALFEEDSTQLDRPFKEEVVVVVRGCTGDKAPGPNSFPLAFFQHCWVVLRIDVMGVCAEFQKHCQFERSLNATFVALIPKKPRAADLRDF